MSSKEKTLSPHQKFRIVLVALDMTSEEFAESINRSKSTCYRYYKGRLSKKNEYLDYKLEKKWQQVRDMIK